MMYNLLRIHSIFTSISGEAGIFPQGSFCTFIRLQGCNLRCVWCDVKEAQKDVGGLMDYREVVKKVNTNRVIITGGEPLRQRTPLRRLIEYLLEMGKDVQVETNGSLPLLSFASVPGVGWAIDRKTPSSKMCEFNMLVQNLGGELIQRGNDIILKYVIATREDLQWAVEDIQALREAGYPLPLAFAFSPVLDDQDRIVCPPDVIGEVQERAQELGILDKAIISLQVHKLLGLP